MSLPPGAFHEGFGGSVSALWIESAASSIRPCARRRSDRWGSVSWP